MPLDGDTGHWPIAIEGRPAVPVSRQPTVIGMIAAPGFLQTLRIGLFVSAATSRTLTSLVAPRPF